MSQTTAPPIGIKKKKPVGTQEISVGEPVVPNKLAAQEMHESALNGESPVATQEVKDAVAQAVTDMFAVTEAWQPKQIIKFVIECPSGQKALVKHLDTMDLVRANLIEELDFFTKRLFPGELDAQGNPIEKTDRETEATIWSVLKDPEKRCRFLQMTNRLMVAASVTPKIIDDFVALKTDSENGERNDVCGYQIESIDEQIKLFGQPVPLLKDGQCYAGAIDFNDRMTFFSELNKPLELIEPFRAKQDAVLASLEPSKIVRDTTE